MTKTDLKISRLIHMLTSQDEEIRKLGILVIKNSFIYPFDIEFILNDIIKGDYFVIHHTQEFINLILEYNEKYK